MIYQLAKTSPLLSGQVRWDMCITNNNGHPEISSLHIVPLSDSIIYNEDNSRVTYNYSHADNVKNLYRNIEDQFFSDTSIYSGKYQLYNSGHKLDPFDHTYEMGLRRMRYQRYNKQFSYLCPMWISEDIDYSKLSFFLSINDANPGRESISLSNERPINTTTRINLSKDMIKYLTEYMSTSANGSPVSDDLISFKFDPVNAYITGLQVDSARMSVIDVSSVISDLVARERPIMEFDDMILRQFKLNHIIAQQLINFNIVFNINDLVNEYTARTLLYHDINVIMTVEYDNRVVAIKDLYTNYTNIPAYDIIKDDYNVDLNVLDYLQDNKCKDLVYVNKVVQPIFHWALLENPDMVYNMYDGFGPIFKDADGEYNRVHGLYYNQANIQNRKYNVIDNTLEWCRHYDLGVADQAIEVLTVTETSKFIIEDNIIWINGNKFDLTGKYSEYRDSKEVKKWLDTEGRERYTLPKKFELNLCTVKYKGTYQIPDDNYLLYGEEEDGVYVVYKDVNYTDGDLGSATLWFMSKSNDDLTLGSLYDYIVLLMKKFENSELDDPDGALIVLPALGLISLIFRNWVAPYKVVVYKSIVPKQIKFDQSYAEVVEYLKNDQSYTYLYRYTGNIIPAFINLDDSVKYNVDFYYKQWSNINDIQEYSRLIKLGYLPEYPKQLIKESNIEESKAVVTKTTKSSNNAYEIDPDSFYSLKQCRFTSIHDSWYDDWNGDITWLNDSRVWNLPDEINMVIKYPDDTNDSIINHEEDEINDYLWNELYEFISEHILRLADENGDDWCRNWIYSKYSMTVESFEYAALDDIKHINYSIKFKLK